MAIVVNPDALAAQGAGLGAEWAPPGPSACVAPGADPVSVSATARLAVQGDGLSALIAHCASLRAAGGAAVTASAHSVCGADADNAALLSGVADGVPAPFSVSSPAPVVVPAVLAPSMPALPAISVPSALPGEALALLLNDGPGAEGLRSFAAYWRAEARRLDEAADTTCRIGQGIDQAWQGVDQQAGANTGANGRWMSLMAGRARSLAAAAEDLAEHFVRAQGDSPRPEEFAAAREELRRAWQANAQAGGACPERVGVAAAALAEKHARASEAAHGYLAAAAVTTDQVGGPVEPAPPIVRADAPDSRTRRGAHTPNRRRQADDRGLVPQPAGAGGDEVTPGSGRGSAPDSVGRGPLGSMVSGELPSGPAVLPSLPSVESQPAGDAAGVAGTVAGLSLGSLARLAPLAAAVPQSAGSMLGSSPLSALSSGLPGLPSGAASPMSSGVPSADSAGFPDPRDADWGDDGVGATLPATGGDTGGGSGGAVAGAPVNPMLSAAALGPAAGRLVVGPGVGAVVAPAGGMGGMGMYPPMMSGRAGDTGERRKDLNPDRRVVLRPVPNAEPVFGELETQLRSRSRRTRGGEGGDAG